MAATQNQTERELVIMLSKGDEAAFAKLFNRYRPRVYGTAIKLLKSAETAEEIVQDVFLKVWQNRESLAEVTKLEGYLFMMARNLIYDHFKRLAHDRKMVADFALRPDYVDDTDHCLLKKQYQQLLQEVVEKLPRQQRTIYKLAREEHLTQEDIAQRLHLSRLTVKKHMAVALKTIRTQLEGHVEFYAIIHLVMYGATLS